MWNENKRNVFMTLPSSQINQVQLAWQLLLILEILLFDIDKENRVTPGTVLVHVCKKKQTYSNGQLKKYNLANGIWYIFFVHSQKIGQIAFDTNLLFMECANSNFKTD